MFFNWNGQRKREKKTVASVEGEFDNSQGCGLFSLFTCRLPKIYNAQDRHRSTTSPIQFGNVQGALQNDKETLPPLPAICAAVRNAEHRIMSERQVALRQTKNQNQRGKLPLSTHTLISIQLVACMHTNLPSNVHVKYDGFFFFVSLWNEAVTTIAANMWKSTVFNVGQKRIANTNATVDTVHKNPCEKL